MKKKLNNQTNPDWAKLYKILDKADILMFDPKEIQEKIEFAYQKRDSAHQLLLQADVLLDEVLRELSGIKNEKTKSNKGRSKR